MKVHLTPDGPKPCHATKRPCKYGEHFDELSKAEKAYAEQFSEQQRSLSSGAFSAQISRAYAHWSVVHKKLHNSAQRERIPVQELNYYATPQGLLEVRRRAVGLAKDEYLELEERVKKITPSTAVFELDEEYISTQVKEGEIYLQGDSLFLENKDREIHIDPLRHYLVEKSSEWLKRLSPEEQEAISWFTSNGFGVMQKSIGAPVHPQVARVLDFLQEHKAIANEQDYDKREALLEEHQVAYAKQYRETVLKALAKAPKLDEPKIIARGTSVGELRELLSLLQDSSSPGELFNAIEAGEFDGDLVNPEARIHKIPLSATVRAKTARGFTDVDYSTDDESRGVILAVKTRSFPCPANVGAWGASEYEVFTSPLNHYRIVGGRRSNDDDFILELEEFEEA